MPAVVVGIIISISFLGIFANLLLRGVAEGSRGKVSVVVWVSKVGVCVVVAHGLSYTNQSWVSDIFTVIVCPLSSSIVAKIAPSSGPPTSSYSLIMVPLTLPFVVDTEHLLCFLFAIFVYTLSIVSQKLKS